MKDGPDSNLLKKSQNCPLNYSVQGELIERLQGFLGDFQVSSNSGGWMDASVLFLNVLRNKRVWMKAIFSETPFRRK